MIGISINNGQAYGVGNPLKGIAIWGIGIDKVHAVDVLVLSKLTMSPFAIYMIKAAQKHINVYTETMTPANVGLYKHYGFS